jgi:hypothetical protein
MVCETEELPQLNASVAGGAGAWRFPFQIGVDERFYDRFAKERTSVERVVGEAEEIRSPPCVILVLRRAATSVAAGFAFRRIVPEVQRDATS